MKLPSSCQVARPEVLVEVDPKRELELLVAEVPNDVISPSSVQLQRSQSLVSLQLKAKGNPAVDYPAVNCESC